MKYDVITIGGATEDITFYTSEGVLIDNKKDLFRQKLLAFEYGAKVKIDKALSNFGGGAANAAVCLSGFGLKAACFAAVGKDSRGERIINNLTKHNVDTALVQKVNKIETGFSFLLVGPGNEHIVFSDRAANSELEIGNSDLEKLENTEWIYLTSLSGKWESDLTKIFSLKSVKIAWNPGHRQILDGLKKIGKYLAKTTILILNKDEAIELVCSDKMYKNKPKAFLNQQKNLLKVLYSYGIKIVVITNGQHGADAYDGFKFYHQPIFKESKRADTTGVGDAFGSSFVAGLDLFKGDIQKSMYLGAKNTSSKVSHAGAQNGLLTKKDLTKLKLI